MSAERVFRIRDAARRLGVSTRTVHRYIDAGKLVAVKLPSGHWRVREGDLVAVMRERLDADRARFPD